MKINMQSVLQKKSDGTIKTTVKCKIYDCTGRYIPYVMSYDTETCEVETVLRVKEDGEGKGWFVISNDNWPTGHGEIARFKGIVKGSYAEIDGERYQEGEYTLIGPVVQMFDSVPLVENSGDTKSEG